MGMESIVPGQKPPVQEAGILDSMESQLALARKLGDVYSHRPDLHTFVGAMSEDHKHAMDYAPDAVKRDEVYVEETRKKIEEQDRAHGKADFERKEGGFALSEMMQAMIVDQINKGWLPDFRAIMTSDYDDLYYGVDAVMKHKDGTYLGAGFDFTVSQQETVVEAKLTKEWDMHAAKGSVTAIKYFEDPETHHKGRLIVPKFIVGGTQADVEEMARAYLSDDEETLKNHKFKYLMMDQISEQLETALAFYEENDNPKYDFAYKQYQRIARVLEGVKESMGYYEVKKNDLDYYQYAKKSRALETIKGFKSQILREQGIEA